MAGQADGLHHLRHPVLDLLRGSPGSSRPLGAAPMGIHGTGVLAERAHASSLRCRGGRSPCAGYGLLAGTLIFSWRFFLLLALYPAWGLVQQFLVVGLLAGNLRKDGRLPEWGDHPRGLPPVRRHPPALDPARHRRRAHGRDHHLRLLPHRQSLRSRAPPRLDRQHRVLLRARQRPPRRSPQRAAYGPDPGEDKARERDRCGRRRRNAGLAQAGQRRQDLPGHVLESRPRRLPAQHDPEGSDPRGPARRGPPHGAPAMPLLPGAPAARLLLVLPPASRCGPSPAPDERGHQYRRSPHGGATPTCSACRSAVPRSPSTSPTSSPTAPGADLPRNARDPLPRALRRAHRRLGTVPRSFRGSLGGGVRGRAQPLLRSPGSPARAAFEGVPAARAHRSIATASSPAGWR